MKHKAGWNFRFAQEGSGFDSVKPLPRVRPFRSLNGGVVKSNLRQQIGSRDQTKLSSTRKNLGKNHGRMTSQEREEIDTIPIPRPKLLTASVSNLVIDVAQSKVDVDVTHDQEGSGECRLVGHEQPTGEPRHSGSEDELLAVLCRGSFCNDKHISIDQSQHDKNPQYCMLKRLSLIGKGSSAVVYRSIHFRSLHLVAEKVVLASGLVKRKQLLTELLTLKKSLCGPNSCENIVQLIDVVANLDGTVSMCLEYMDSSLQDIVSCGGCQNETVLRGISRQILVGLDFLHERRLMHRDIKPGNVLVNLSGCVKISDLGILRDLSGEASVADSFVGTYHYMSPERIAGKSYTFSSDIWGLGMTILTVLLGGFPFALSEKTGYWSLMSKIQDAPLPIPSEETLCSRHFRDFIESCCTKDFQRRPCAKDLLRCDFIRSCDYNPSDKKNATFQEWLRTSIQNHKSMRSLRESVPESCRDEASLPPPPSASPKYQSADLNQGEQESQILAPSSLFPPGKCEYDIRSIAGELQAYLLACKSSSSHYISTHPLPVLDSQKVTQLAECLKCSENCIQSTFSSVLSKYGGSQTCLRSSSDVEDSDQIRPENNEVDCESMPNNESKRTALQALDCVRSSLESLYNQYPDDFEDEPDDELTIM
jgi:serine/threonine protein kinase